MSTLAAAVLIIDDEPYESCLESIRHLDEVYVLTNQLSILESARVFRAQGRVIPTPTCIEAVGELLLSSTEADWLLLIDPDERLMYRDLAALLSCLDSSGENIVGYSVGYNLLFSGCPLRRTYRGLRKTKLVRPRRVRWPTNIHSLPEMISVNDIFSDLPEQTAFIESDLIGDLSGRLARHARWAALEAAQRTTISVGGRRIADVVAKSLDEYFIARSCSEDGVAGVLNGLLHLNKEIAGLLFEAAAFGISDNELKQIQAVQKVLGRAARSLIKITDRIP